MRIRWAIPKDVDRLTALDRHLSPAQLAQAGLDALEDLIRELGLPSRPEELGLRSAELPEEFRELGKRWVHTA